MAWRLPRQTGHNFMEVFSRLALVAKLYVCTAKYETLGAQGVHKMSKYGPLGVS